MDVVTHDQELKIGKYSCNIVYDDFIGWFCNISHLSNTDIYEQFGISRSELTDLVGYDDGGEFPQCKTAEDLTKMIEYIMSKDLKEFPESGYCETRDDRLISYLSNTKEQTKASSGPVVPIGVAWNSFSYWFIVASSSKTKYTLDQLLKFITIEHSDSISETLVEDYTGRTIKALVDSPQFTGVRLGEKIKILELDKKHNNYILDKTSNGSSGMCITTPLRLDQWELVDESVSKSPVTLTMIEIQDECKKRFPIGCKFICPNSRTANVLKDDSCTYSINGTDIYAHLGAGCLYKNGKYATLVENTPKETVTKISDPESDFIVGKWYKHSVHGYLGKFLKFKGDEFVASEYYMMENYRNVSYTFIPYDKERWIEATEEDLKGKIPQESITEKVETNNQKDYICKKTSIENVHSIDLKLSTKKKTNKFKI